jgi:hypothetical protein
MPPDLQEAFLFICHVLLNYDTNISNCTAIRNNSSRQELERTESLMKSVIGTSPKLFRPPCAETD